ncbi:protein kinase domain-containing protein [Sorangium sp. So ce1153]|uniref:protein kinase domain-containing protein n=1 Tax=Sorangium sp. So ce1153 TaxID=3133333 RepID=UPI003F60321C
MLATSRIDMVGESPYASDVEAVQFAIAELPNSDPYRLWGLVELLEPTTGRLYELGMLVLGYSALYIVEILSGPGRYEGDQVDWYHTPPDAPRRWMEPPLQLAKLKKNILKSRLRSKMKDPDRVPHVEPLIFLSNPNVELRLEGDGRSAVVGRGELLAALTKHEFPGAPASLRADRIDSVLAADIAQALAAIGVRKRKGKLYAGAYELGPLVDDGIFQPSGSADGPAAPSGYQDRIATHRDTPRLTRRARVYLVPQQTTVARRQLLRRAADREVQLLYGVREHPNVLTFVEYVADAPLGPTVLFDAFEGGVPLDAFLRQNPDLPFHERITLVEQVARAVDYCHKKDVRHGALGPHAVLVRRDSEGVLESRLFNFQLGAGQQVRSTVHWSALASDPWAVYQAPELREEAGGPTPVSDIFSLGALAYLVFTGRPPAPSVLELDARLARDHHLDPRAVDDAMAGPLADVIVMATERAVPARADDAGEWIELLLDQITRPEPVPAAPEIDPLDARKDDELGGDLTVKSILGRGATSRVLQVERAVDRRAYALKVSMAPEHDERLVEEVKLLRTLDHPRIVRVVEQRSIADRTCLLLTLAGEQTLQRFLAREGSVSLDYASRFGEDLLSALEELEEKKIVHRDIKPANVGVGSPGKGAMHLTLFDFSLGLAPITEIGVGTAVYRDPFLRQRGAWDAAADRWSAAVTLHEMLTGARPTIDDDLTVEGLASPKTTLAAERFDPAVRDRLVAFFDRALAPDVELRFASAREMRRAWIAGFEAPLATALVPAVLPSSAAGPGSAATRAPEQTPAAWDPADLTDEQLAAIRPETPAEALPLSARARNALDRAGVLCAGDLLALPDNRLSSVRGVGRRVAQEILGLRERWKAVHALVPVAPTPFFSGGYRGDDVLLTTTKLDTALVLALGDAGLHSLLAVAEAPAVQVTAIARRSGFEPSVLSELLGRESRAAGDRTCPQTLEAWLAALLPASKKRTAYLVSLYGLADPFTARLDVTVREVAAHHRVSTANVYQRLGEARTAWAKHGAIAELRDLAHALLDEGGGALPLDRAAEALLSRLAHDRGAPEALRRARAAALFHVIDEVEHGQPGRLRVMRLTGGSVWAFTNEDHKPVVEALGHVADELAGRAILASPGEAARRFTEVVRGTPLAALAVERLVDLAAAASRSAARSTRLEIYPRGLPAERALALSAAVLASGLTPDEIQKRVGARYPDAAPLPDPPALDALLQPHDLVWNPTSGRYQRLGEGQPTSLVTTGPQIPRLSTASTGEPRAMDPEAIDARSFDEKIAHALDRRLLRVLGVRADFAREAALALARRAGTAAVSFDAELIAAMKRQIEKLGVDADLVHETDRLGPAGPDWPNLLRLAELAADDVAAKLLPPERPLVLTSPGLLARYRLTSFLAKVIETSKRRDAAAIFLVVPAHDAGGLPLINQELPIRGVLPSDGLWVSPHWLANKHNAAA